jgi:hypothetical protein
MEFIGLQMKCLTGMIGGIALFGTDGDVTTQNQCQCFKGMYVIIKLGGGCTLNQQRLVKTLFG